MATYFELAHIACNVYSMDFPYINKNVHDWFPLEYTASSEEKFKSTSRRGLFACIYENFATKECILAVKGTSSLTDILSDGDFFLGNYMKHRFIPELGELMQYMFHMKVHYPKHSYSTITGHSLGGILAKMAAAITGDTQKVLAFNSPGVKAALQVVPNSIIHHPKKVQTIITFGDDIGNFCKNNDIGHYIEISNIASSKGTRILERVAMISAGVSEGVMGGALGGAAVGTTVFPAVGTVVGAVVGAIGGAAVGGIAGEGFIELREHSMEGVIKSMREDTKYNFSAEF
jgi:outer membrane lipoprotein SlyB